MNDLRKTWPKKLHVEQSAVFKLERRVDMYLRLSTLWGYIEAMGGKLEITPDSRNKPCGSTHSRRSILKTKLNHNHIKL